MQMCVFSLIGLTFFGTAGILLIVYGYTQLVVQITAIVLCLLATLFFLLDIAMLFAWVSRLSVNPRISKRRETIRLRFPFACRFWKRKCSVCKRCCYYEGVEYLPRKDEEPHLLEREKAKVSARRERIFLNTLRKVKNKLNYFNSATV